MKIHLLILCLFLSSCATTPSQRFPTFNEEIQAMKSVDVILDVFIYSDIKGSDTGVNKEHHAKALEYAQEYISAEFKIRGLEPNFVYTNYGLFFEPSNEHNYVYSEDRKSLNKIYHAESSLKNSAPMWSEKETREYLKTVMEYSAQYNMPKQETPYPGNTQSSDAYVKDEDKPKELNSETVENFFTKASIPESIANLPSDHFAIIKISAGDIPKSKTVGKAIATGILTTLLTGGAVTAIGTNASSANTHVAFINKTNGKLLWHNNLDNQSSRDINHLDFIIQQSLRPLPSSEGIALTNPLSHEKKRVIGKEFDETKWEDDETDILGHPEI